MVRTKSIFLVLISLFLFFRTVTAQEDFYCNDTCVPTNNSCIISCGQTLTVQSTDTIDYFNYTLTSAYMYVNFTLNGQPFVNYDPYADWTAERCPIGVPAGCTQQGAGAQDTCDQNLPVGTYIFGVKKIGLGAGTYNISLTCEALMDKPTIIEPESKIYYNTTINLTTKCVGKYASYNINRSLDDQLNVTFGFSVSNNTSYTTTLSNLVEGNHDVYITCYNETIYVQSDRVYFTIVIPRHNLEAWAQGPSFFTIGKTELVNVYVKNTGNMIDNYDVSFEKQTTGMYPPHLIDVSMPSNRIIALEPGKVGSTFARLTLLGPIDTGIITFNVTSETNSSVSYLAQSIEFSGGSPINLPEFELLGLFQILILTCLILIISRSKIKKP